MDAKSIATVLLAAFVIDRLIAAIMFVASLVALSHGNDEKTRATRTEHLRKLVYFLISGVLSAAVVLSGVISVDAIQFGTVPKAWSGLILWLILVGGANRISEFIGKSEAPAPPPAPKQTEFHVVGTLSLDEKSLAKLPDVPGR
ncbi:MAG: hypothetical protein QOI24_3686 [Acidobacteriota bacterium]|jgi:hypothetical protein|nr:hypothetical protein [Acidobacteriota bacterium]